jgi:hypothetical protein
VIGLNLFFAIRTLSLVKGKRKNGYEMPNSKRLIARDAVRSLCKRDAFGKPSY